MISQTDIDISMISQGSEVRQQDTSFIPRWLNQFMSVLHNKEESFIDDADNNDIELEEKYYFLGKKFKLSNIFMKFYTGNDDTKFMRMVDYEFIAYDLQTILDLNIITYMCNKLENKQISIRNAYAPALRSIGSSINIHQDLLPKLTTQTSGSKGQYSVISCILKWDKISPYI